MARELLVKYKQAKPGSIQFGDAVRVGSTDEFKTKVLSRIDSMVGRQRVVDLLVTAPSGMEVLVWDQGLPDNLLEVIAWAFTNPDIY